MFTEGKMVKRWVVNRFLITTPLFASNVHFPPFVASKTCQRYEIDTMIAASMIVPLLILIPVGKFADIFSRKMTFYVTISLYCILHLLLVYTPDPAAFTGSRVLQGFHMLGSVTSGAISAELVPVSLLGRYFDVLGFSSGLASIMGPIVARIMWNIIGQSSLFISILIIMIASVVFLSTIPETSEIWTNDCEKHRFSRLKRAWATPNSAAESRSLPVLPASS